MTGDNVVFERDMVVAETKCTQIGGSCKQTKEVEIMLRGRDCVLALRRFGVLTTQFIDGDKVYVVIKRYM